MAKANRHRSTHAALGLTLHGSSLEVALAKALCEAFGGRVELESSSQLGAVFKRVQDAVECAEEIERQAVQAQRRAGQSGSCCAFGVDAGPDALATAVTLSQEASPGTVVLSRAALTRAGNRLGRVVEPLGSLKVGSSHIEAFLLGGRQEPRGEPERPLANPVVMVVGVLGLAFLALGVVLTVVPKPEPVVSPVSPPKAEEAPPEPAEPRVPPPPPPKEDVVIQERRTAPPPARSGSPPRQVRSQPAPAAVESRGETREPAGPPETELERFRDLDFNRDGKLTRQEIPFEQRKYFMWADTDADGVITLEEFKAAYRARGVRRAGG